MTLLSPAGADAAAEMVRAAADAGRTLEIVGGGSKRGLGRATVTDDVLDLAALRGIVDYDSSELVLTAAAATPLAEIEAALDAERQMLAFEPPDWSALLPSNAAPTLGGIIACNMAGPRRVRAGAARDHLLGFAAINGRGERWKAGGRVVKNVTGYDMCKLQAGAYGTLSVLTEISIRVLPRPEASCSLVLHGLSDAAAITAMATALNSPHEVSAAAHLPADVAARSTTPGIAGNAAAVTVLRLEGPQPSIDYRRSQFAAMFGGSGQLDTTASVALWREIAAAAPLIAAPAATVWRLCPTPSAAAALVARIRERLAVEAFYDWGGGLVWLALDAAAAEDCGAAVIRGALAQCGGHATLVRASVTARAAIAVFQPAAGALDALHQRVKASFDPLGIFNPGRMQREV